MSEGHVEGRKRLLRSEAARLTVERLLASNPAVILASLHSQPLARPILLAWPQQHHLACGAFVPLPPSPFALRHEAALKRLVSHLKSRVLSTDLDDCDARDDLVDLVARECRS